MRRFLFSLASVSVFLNKVVLCIHFLDFSRAETYFWLPSVFFLDLIFAGLVYGLGTSCRLLTTFMVLFTVLVDAAGVTAVIGHGLTMPWALAVWALTEWQDFQILVRAKAEESYIQVWMVALVQVVWAFLLALCYTYMKQTTTALPLVMRFSYARWKHPGALLLVYLLLMTTLRPQDPYKKLSQTPCFTVSLEIIEGIKQYREHKHKAMHLSQDEHFDSSRPRNYQVPESFAPLNVVVIFLESTRADIMPFDGSTSWAERFVSAGQDDITPFYSNWTKLDETLYIPLIKSASGYTHKSLLSTLCSMHTLPIQGTIEAFYELYHPCLPQRLGHLNYSSIFFQPTVENWEHEKDLIRRIGFPEFFGKESYDNMIGASEDFKTSHTVNYFGYEDSIMLPVIMEWVDKQRSPFFLSYLSGITHDPYNIPPSVNWTRRFFSDNEKVNDYLNTVLYMDHWLEKLVGEFEARNLLESTLVVMLGDHGITMFERDSVSFTTFDQKYEEAMDVGISFYSRSEQWKSILRELDDAAITNGTYSSIDVVPTILEILGIEERGKKSNNLVDGRSMLHASGQRLRLSIANPGYTMVLRDRSYVLVRRPSNKPEAFDLRVDPEQKKPLLIVSSTKGELARWGDKAVAFLRFVEEDLHWSYREGRRCSNCTLSLLLTLESLDDWSPDMATSRYSSLSEMTDDWSPDMATSRYSSLSEMTDDAPNGLLRKVHLRISTNHSMDSRQQ